MFMFINALLMAMLVPAVAGPSLAERGTCAAHLDGAALVTRVELPAGVMIEGPWNIVHRGKVAEGEKRFIMLAALDRMIRTDALTGEKQVIPLPHRIEMAFEGTTPVELIENAADMWCQTVMRVQRSHALDEMRPQQVPPTRITALPAILWGAS